MNGRSCVQRNSLKLANGLNFINRSIDYYIHTHTHNASSLFAHSLQVNINKVVFLAPKKAICSNIELFVLYLWLWFSMYIAYQLCGKTHPHIKSPFAYISIIFPNQMKQNIHFRLRSNDRQFSCEAKYRLFFSFQNLFFFTTKRNRDETKLCSPQCTFQVVSLFVDDRWNKEY